MVRVYWQNLNISVPHQPTEDRSRDTLCSAKSRSCRLPSPTNRAVRITVGQISSAKRQNDGRTFYLRYIASGPLSK